MNYEEWNDLRKKMALHQYAAEAADMMVPYDEGLVRARLRMAQADAATEENVQGDPAVQDWRNREHNMGAALIALEKLGYKVTR